MKYNNFEAKSSWELQTIARIATEQVRETHGDSLDATIIPTAGSGAPRGALYPIEGSMVAYRRRLEAGRAPAIEEESDEEYDSWEFRSQIDFSDSDSDSLDEWVDRLEIADPPTPYVNVVVGTRSLWATHSDQLYLMLRDVIPSRFYLRYGTTILSQAHIPLGMYGVSDGVTITVVPTPLMGGLKPTLYVRQCELLDHEIKMEGVRRVHRLRLWCMQNARRKVQRSLAQPQSRSTTEEIHDQWNFTVDFFGKQKQFNLLLWFESVTCLMDQLAYARNGNEIVNAIGAFIRSLTGKAVSVSLVGHFIDLFLNGSPGPDSSSSASDLERLFDEIEDAMSSSPPSDDEEEDAEPQGIEMADCLSSFRKLFSTVDAFKDSPLARKVTTMMYYLVCNGLLDSVGITMDFCQFSESARAYFREKFKPGFGMVYSILDGLSFVLERLYMAWKLGDASALWHTNDTYSRFADRVAGIRTKSLGLCNPKAFGIEYHEFVREVEQALAEGKTIVSFLGKQERGPMKNLLFELEKFRADIVVAQAASMGRRMPLGVNIFGDSGVLKSTVEELLGVHYGRVRSKPLGPEYRYTIVPTAEFMSGFTSKVWWMTIDDAAARRPGVCAELDPTIRDMLQLLNNVSWCPPQAELELKGKTPCYAEFVGVTTNVHHLHAHTYFENEVAIRRRFRLHIHVEIKEEYRVEGTTMADRTKIPPTPEGKYPDHWILTAYKIQADDQNRARLIKVFGSDNIYEFLRFFTSEIREHDREQQNQRVTSEHIKQAQVCDECFLPECVCDTAAQQSTELVVGAIGLLQLAFMWMVYYQGKTHLPRALRATIMEACSELGRTASTPQVRAVAKDLANVAGKAALGVVQEEIGDLKTYLLARLKEKKEQLLGPFKKVLAGLVTAGGMYALWKFTRRPVSQGSEVSRPTPLPSEAVGPNVWYKEDFIPSELDLGQLPAHGSLASIREIVKRNTVHITCRRNIIENGEVKVGRTDGNALGLGGNLYVANRHVMGLHPEIVISVVEHPQLGGVNPNVEYCLSQKDMWRYKNTDLMFFVLRNHPEKRVIHKHFAKKIDNYGPINGVMIHRNAESEISEIEMRAAKCAVGAPVKGQSSGFYWEARPRTDTIVGDCGSPYLLHHPAGLMIGGIHCAGKPGYSYALPIDQQIISQAQTALREIPIEPGKVNLADSQGNKISLAPLHEKSVFRFMESGQARVFGSFPGFRPKHRSRVRKSFIYDEMIAMGYPDLFGAPQTHGWRVWRNAALPIVTQEFRADQDAIFECAEAYLSDVLEGLDPSWLSQFTRLDEDSVVNGFPGVRFLEAMNKNSSMGFPWRKKKKHFLREKTPFPPYDVMWEFDEDFMKRVHAIREKHLRGERANPIFTAHMKDEARKWSKIKNDKTRQMAGCPCDYIFHVRQYLMNFVRMFQNNPLLFEGVPGLNHASIQWDQLFHYLTQHGLDQMIAGDFGDYDKRMQAVAILAAYWVIYKIALAAGWDEQHARVILCIGHDMAFCFMDFNGDLVQFFGSNPSGHPLTVIINCIVNSIYMRYVYKRVGLDLSSFKRNVALVTYGDDNEMGVAKAISELFNHTSIQKYLGEIGVTYTMADKEQASVPLVSVFSTTFLKRSWRFEPELGIIVAPLAEESIGRSLTKGIPSSAICPEAQACATIQSALREYFWYGRARFDEMRKEFDRVITQKDLWVYSDDLPTFDRLLADFKANSSGYSCACQAQALDYLSHPDHVALLRVCTGENYLVRKPIGSLDSQLLRRSLGEGPVRVGDKATREGDPQSLYLEKQHAGLQTPQLDAHNGLINVEEEIPPTKICEVWPTLQAGEVTDTENTVTSKVAAENLTFVDGAVAPSYEVKTSVVHQDQSDDGNELAVLGQFLSRPVVIKSFTWTEATPLTPSIFFPWYEYFNNTFIKNKLTNYARLRCKLKLKFVINASPFYFGSLRACYFPLDGPTGSRANFGVGSANLVRFSQVPGVYLEPQNMSSTEMTLPFVWVADWLDTGVASQFKCMGAMNIVEYASLDSANGVAGTGVTVKVYAWAEDVEIAAPTKGALLQSEEYKEKDGVVSRPATAIASVARMASNHPWLAPYARATEIGATAVAGIAKLFGYSNPPLIEDSQPVTVKSFHAMANTSTRVPLDVLAIDPKNEVDISSAQNGYTGEDELAISYLVQKESFIESSTWTSALASDTPLFTSTVNPGLARVTGSEIHYTPMAYFGEMFRFWRGDLKFKFRFIKTKYHRGRVSITWDPNYNIQSDADTATTNYTRIVDLEFEDEVEVVIPYRAVTPYLLLHTAQTFSNSVTPAVTLDKEYDNGVLIVRVLNTLTGPATTPQIQMLTYVSGCDNMEFAVPGELPDTYAVLQSAEVMELETPASTKASVTVGERIASIRPLLHRQSYWCTQGLGSAWDETNTLLATGWRNTHNYLPKIPIPYADTNYACTWQLGAPSSPFQFCKNHPINWVTAAFAAYKGSTNMSFNAMNGDEISGNASEIFTLAVTRYTKDFIVRSTKQQRNCATDTNSVTAFSSMGRSSNVDAPGTSNASVISGRTGMSLTNPRTQAALQVHIPQYVNHRLLIAYPPLRHSNFVAGGTIHDNVDLQSEWYQRAAASSAAAWPVVDIYYGAGVDFNPVFFVCAPSITSIAAPTASNVAVP